MEFSELHSKMSSVENMVGHQPTSAESIIGGLAGVLNEAYASSISHKRRGEILERVIHCLGYMADVEFNKHEKQVKQLERELDV